MAQTNVIPLPVTKQESTRFNFTMQRLKRVIVTGKTYYVYDEEQDGLCMRISAGGCKSFVYYRKIHGKPERIPLGRINSISITDARNACKQHEGCRAAGGNPAVERRDARKKGIRIDELMKSWLRSAKAKKLRRWKDEERLYDLHIKNSLGRKEAVNVSATDIERLMSRLESKPRTANKVHDLLRRIYRQALKQKKVTENPCMGVTRYAEQVRDRVLSTEEVQNFLAAVNDENEPWKSYFKLLLLTGARKTAVASIRWQDLNLDTGVWTVPGWSSKNKKAFAIALVPQAVNVLSELERIDQQWVFPANSKAGHITTPTKAWERIKKRANLPDVRIHDLRRTIGTTLAIQGASSHVIAKALGHKSLQSAAAYVHMDTEVARAALEGVTGGWMK